MAKDLCGYCQRDITGLLIRCVECTEFDLCLQCFSCGVESGPHKKEHKYRVGHVGGPAAFELEKPWSLAEEHMLLDAVEQYGFGNWSDVAGHVETRTETECEEHYVQYYIHGNIGKATFPSESTSRVTDHSCPEGGPLSPSITTPLPPLELSLQEQQELGYMPLRDDFEREYDNEAETLVSGLAINAEDDDLDLSVKLSCIGKYRVRLRERDRRKRIARTHSLISTSVIPNKNCKTPNPKRKFAKEDREFVEKMKVFTPFQMSEDLERLQDGLLKEKEEKAKITDMSELRKQGVTILSDVEEFEEEKFKREKRKENRKKLNSLSTPKRNSTVSKKAEGKVEKLDILIDDDDIKDEEEAMEDNKEMATMPGYDLLSEREKKLCNSIHMLPANYNTIKTCIIKDYLQRRQGVPVKIRFPSGMDKTHRRRIMSFLSDNGWIGVT
ncbi:transcriptional adapter 2-beta-like [Littorina saxatilis]|uniref:transcriptional adapter 2-beta-like n=1 Tax=Littorina saxatilis TaxID=31220 RepID=UPI0038B5E9FB